MKEMVTVAAIGTLLLAGCSQVSGSSVQEPYQENAVAEGAGESMSQQEGTVLYKGTVKEVDLSIEERVSLTEFVPTEGDGQQYDEVILLLNADIPLLDKRTGEPLSLEGLAPGDEVEATLVEHAPMTMSLPPQLPGNGIIQVEVIK